MFKVAIDTHWQLLSCEGDPLMPRLTSLLVGIQRTGTLAAACRASGLSYRYAWGLLREGDRAFGQPLVESRRGTGAQLTALGERLAWADQRIAARLKPMLDSLASEVESEIERALWATKPVLRLQASHGFAVEAMRQYMVDHLMPIDLKYRDSDELIDVLADRRCDLIGLHLPIGDLEQSAATHYAAHMDPDWKMVHLANRRQGLVVAPGNPKRIVALDDLSRDDVRFVNRQPGSGTRVTFDLALQQADVEASTIRGYDIAEYTHAAVAAYVGSGMADVGFALELPARRFGLDFVPILSERYFFVCRGEFLAEPMGEAILEVLRRPELHALIAALPGYDPVDVGRIERVGDVFPIPKRGRAKPAAQRPRASA